MKKITAVAGGMLIAGCLGAFEPPAFTLDTNVKFSSEHTFRGSRQTKKAFLPSAEIGLPVLEKGRLYLGVDAVLGLAAPATISRSIEFGCANELRSYAGFSYGVTDIFTLDIGFIHRCYTNLPQESRDHLGLKRNAEEVYAGVMADVLLSPSVYLFYCPTWKSFALEGRVAYSYDLSQFLVNGFAVEFGAKLGYDNTERPFGFRHVNLPAEPTEDDIAGAARIKSEFERKKAAVYYGLNADLVYSFNEHAKARIGVEVAGNSADKKHWRNGLGLLPKNSLWLNASVGCSF
jgi:hypothetical protein